MVSGTRQRRHEATSSRRRRALPLRQRRLHGADGTDLAVQCAGTDGPVVVLANGLGGSMVAWRPLVAGLADRYRLASWDYRGLYASGPPTRPASVAIEDHCADLGSLLDSLSAERVVLVGWSMGVQVAVQFALDHPARVAGLVLVCGAPGDPFAGVLHTRTSRVWVPAVCRAVEAAPFPFGAAVRGLAALPMAPEILRGAGIVAPSCDLEVLRELAGQFARLDWRVYARSMRAMGRHDAWARLGEITAPTLAVAGTRDLFTPLETMTRLAAGVRGAELLVVEGATHYAPIEYPELLEQSIARFLAQRARWGRAVPVPGGARRGGTHVVEPG